MNTLLLVLIASLCGLSRALAIPIAARDARLSRSNAEPGVRTVKIVGMYVSNEDDDVTNFQDTVVSTTPFSRKSPPDVPI